MTIEELLTLHEQTTEKARGIMRAKNSDYTAGSADPFANFRASEALGVPGVLSILIRMMDKMQRVRSFVELGELKVKAETVDDAFLDIVNYAILAQGMLKDEKAAA